MLYLCDYIKRHGTPLNYNGPRRGKFGKVKVKDNAKIIRKQRGAFNLDIGRRLSEDDIVDDASDIFQQNKGYWPSEFCSDTDIVQNVNRIKSNTSRTQNDGNHSGDKRRFKILCSIEANVNNEIVAEEINVYIDWGGQSRTPV